jgi:hypothetical protein
LVALFIGVGGMSYLAAITDWVRAWGPVAVGAVGLLTGLVLWIGLSWARDFRAKAYERRVRGRALAALNGPLRVLAVNGPAFDER